MSDPRSKLENGICFNFADLYGDACCRNFQQISCRKGATGNVHGNKVNNLAKKILINISASF